MTSREIHEQITAYVENRIDEQEYRAKLAAHAKPCPDCGAAFETELISTAVLPERPPEPASLNAATGSAAEASSAAAEPSGVAAETSGTAPQAERPQPAAPAAQPADAARGFVSDGIVRMFASPFGVAVAIVVIIVAAVNLTRTQEASADAAGTSGGSRNEIVHHPVSSAYLGSRAADGFEAFVRAKRHPEHATSSCDELDKYFHAGGVAYTVECPQIPIQLIGGDIGTEGSAHVAHLVYGARDTVVYVVVVPMAVVKRGVVMSAPPSVVRELESGKVIWEQPMPTVTLAIVRRGELIYAFVSNVPRFRMRDFLPAG